jgi:hypothetical protein
MRGDLRLVSALKAFSLPAFRRLRPSLLSAHSGFTRSNDGYRLIARRHGNRVRLTRRGHDWADRYPLITEAMAALPQDGTIDGEVGQQHAEKTENDRIALLEVEDLKVQEIRKAKEHQELAE